jgi:hypothetical protein
LEGFFGKTLCEAFSDLDLTIFATTFSVLPISAAPFS